MILSSVLLVTNMVLAVLNYKLQNHKMAMFSTFASGSVFISLAVKILG